MLNNLKNKKKKKKKGFTLIELIIVIAIIAILAALAIPKFSSVRKSANLKADIANAKTIATATSALLAEESIKPSSTAIELSGEDSTSEKIREYLQTVPTPKAGNENDKFIIKTENENVIVYIAASASAGAETNQVYPEPSAKINNVWYGTKE